MIKWLCNKIHHIYVLKLPFMTIATTKYDTILILKPQLIWKPCVTIQIYTNLESLEKLVTKKSKIVTFMVTTPHCFNWVNLAKAHPTRVYNHHGPYKLTLRRLQSNVTKHWKIHESPKLKNIITIIIRDNMFGRTNKRKDIRTYEAGKGK